MLTLREGVCLRGEVGTVKMIHIVIAMLLLQCGGAALLAGILGYFHRLYGRRYLLLWSKSWLASSVRLLVSAIPFFFPSIISSKSLTFAVTFTVITASYFQVSWLLFGAYEMATGKSTSQRLIRITLLGSVVVALFAALLIRSGWLGPEARNLLGVGEEWLITGAAFCLGAYGVFRGWTRKKSFGRRLTGLAMIVSGLYQVAYFSLAAVDAIFKTQLFTQLHYGMLLDFPLQSAIGLGLVIWLLEEERENVLRASDALRESEQQLRLAASAANLDIWEIDVVTGRQISGRYAQVGPPVETYQKFLNLVHPSDRPAVEEAARRAIKESAPFDVEFRIVLEGGTRWLASRGATFRDENGRAVRVIGAAQDITERKQTEEALRESESLFRTLAETISAGLYIYRGNRYVYVNSGAEKNTGYTRDELLSMDIWEPFHPDFRDTIRQRAIARQHGSDAPSHYEAKLLTKSGEERWGYITAKVISYQGEQAVLATSFDITQRKRAEEALRASEERYRAFVANSSEGIYRIELDQPLLIDLPVREQAELFLQRGYLAECNEAFARMYGYDSADPLIGRRTGEFWAAPEEEQVQWLIDWVLAGHRMIDLETREQDREGNILYFLNNTVGIVENGFLMRVWGTQRDVTERRRTEEALRISEERFFKAFNLSPHPMSIATLADSRYIIVNESTLETTGYTRDEMIGRSPGEIGLWVDSSDRARVRREIDEQERIHNLELRYKTKWGEERNALFSAEVIELDGKPCLLTTTNDITDRKRAEEAVRKSELEYRNLFESANDAIVIFEPKDEIILEANSRACEFYGFSKDELIGMSLKSFSKEVVRGEQFIYQTLRDRSRTGFETVHIRRDGSPIHMMVNGSVIEYGGRIAILSINRDITDRKRVEEEQAALQSALQSAVIEWRQTFDAIRSPIVILDSRGTVKRLNRIAKEMIGRDYGDIIGKDIRLIASNEPWQKAADVATSIDECRGQQPSQVKDEATSTIWDITASRASMLEAGEAVIIVARDVTTIFELQESLRRSETMAAMGQLVAGVAHEVRNPLFGISATLDAFETRFGERKEYQNYLGVLRAEAERLNSLMRELLEYGKPHSLKLSKESLSETVARAVENSHAVAERMSVRVENLIEDKVATVIIDSERMIQVFQNLIDNAVQHSPRGGVVRIEARETVTAGDRWIECLISDSGPGFRAEDMPNIFKPFFTRRRGGTGLGLSIVQRIVEEHQGGIFLGNREEGGAIVQVRLRPANSNKNGED